MQIDQVQILNWLYPWQEYCQTCLQLTVNCNTAAEHHSGGLAGVGVLVMIFWLKCVFTVFLQQR